MDTQGILGALLGAALLGLISASPADYLFTMGRSLEQGQGTDACLQMINFAGPDQDPDQPYSVIVSISFVRKYNYDKLEQEGTVFLHEISSTDPNYEECFKVIGPSDPIKYYVDTYTATAIATMSFVDTYGETIELELFNKTADVKVYKTAKTTLIQTDKPVYKPGQTVKFRVMTLDEDFIPETKGYSQITIDSPAGLRVAQWDKVTANNGLVSLELDLGTDPPLGEWTIKVETGDNVPPSQIFKVEEYVLPKYEVTITPPDYLTPTTNQVEGKVCAKYTYGKPVKGTVAMRMCYTRPWYGRYDANTERPCVEIQEKIDGCYQFSVDADELGLANKTYSMWGQLKINANVTEDGTGIMLSGESSGPGLTSSPIKIAIEDTSGGYFKPSFPYKGRVVVTAPDGSPAIGEEIRVDASYWGTKKFQRTFMTDQNGYIDFVINDLTPDVGTLNIEALSTVYAPQWGHFHQRYDYYWRHDISVSSAYHTVRQWYSPSDSYIYVPEITTEMPCGSTHEIDVFYTTDPTAENQFNIMVTSGHKMVEKISKTHMYDGSMIDLNLLSVNPSQVLETYVPPPTPVFGLEQINVTIQEGDTAVLPCSVDYLNDHKVVWTDKWSRLLTVEDQRIVHDLRISIERPFNRDWNLHIRKVAYTDSGKYICQINTNPVKTKTVMLTVLEHPTPPPPEAYEPEIVPEFYSPLGAERKRRQANSPVIAHFKHSLRITADMSPDAKILLYYTRDDGEIVGATTDVKVESCFKHQASMRFSVDKAMPGEDVDLTLEAAGDATCFVGVVDKSVNLLGGEGSMLTPKKVYDAVRKYSTQRFWHSYWQEDDEYCESKADDSEKDAEETYGGYDSEPEGADTSTAFRDASLWLISGGEYMFRPCKQRVYYTYQVPFLRTGAGRQQIGPSGAVPESVGAGPKLPDNAPSNTPSPEVEIRSFFPETWLWEMFSVDTTGSITVTTTVPDTITQWTGNALCTHPTLGLGVSPIVDLTAFQPFFVSLTMPYSAVRGETLPLKVTVFSYLENCIAMQVNIVETEGLAIPGVTSLQLCLCGGESDTTTFLITPTIIGEVEIEATAVSFASQSICTNVILSDEGVGVADGVQRQLLVEAEGVPQDLTRSSYACVKAGEEVIVEEDIVFPEDMVPGSERATVAVMGDIMGPTLSGIRNLLRMPYGCGEQNVASWAPNIAVLEYLQGTNQLTQQQEQDAKRNMLSGYMRQLNYRHHDHSFSAFGENSFSNSSGSGWLTAFVVKTMAQSAKYITIDPSDMIKSAEFLISTQEPNGCFPTVGKVFSSYMKGGLSDGQNPAGLTAFYLTALIEADLQDQSDAIARGFECLDTFILSDVDTYTLAVMAYAYTLYPPVVQRRNIILDELMRRKQSAGNIYWKRSEDSTLEEDVDRPTWYWYRAPSAEVETTAYVLLSLLSDGLQQMSTLQSAIQWVTKQRNPYGGFSSTQDTVVAIQALAEFASLTYIDGASTVHVEATSQQLDHTFEVTQANSIVYQSQSFPLREGSVRMKISGEGCALVQTNLKYNIYKDFAGPAFDVNVRTFRSSLNKRSCAHRQLNICAKYVMDGGVSNMAIIEIRMLTGWVPVESTLKDLVENGEIEKYEMDNSYVQMYFDQITSSRMCVTFEVEQEMRLSPKPGKVHVYDYYETDYSVTVPYNIKTTCGTKEEIPFDNEGLDCTIMQCRVDTEKMPEEVYSKPEEFISCPFCPPGVPAATDLEKIYCDSDVVYKAVVGRKGDFPIKLKANIREKKKKLLDLFLFQRMSPACTCPNLGAPESKALIFTKKFTLNTATDELVIGDETHVMEYSRKLERKVRHMAGRGRFCDKLERRRRKAELKMDRLSRRRRQ